MGVQVPPPLDPQHLALKQGCSEESAECEQQGDQEDGEVSGSAQCHGRNMDGKTSRCQVVKLSNCQEQAV